MLTQDRLKDLVDYNPATGEFVRKVRTSNSVQAGQPAGCINKAGYSVFHVAGKLQYAHRLAWLHQHGEWPAEQIDHINGDRSDNRIENLRAVSRRQNQQNQLKHRAGATLGASYDKRNGRWQTSIYVGGKSRYLGHYDTAEQAHAAYMDAVKEAA